MWPWGHLAFGYLLYSIGHRLSTDRPPDQIAVISLITATQVPDLVDKPLAYWFGVLPGGRTLAHSMLFVVPAAVVMIWASDRYFERRYGIAGAVGLLSHPLADAIPLVLNGSWSRLTFLLWPITPAPDYRASGFGFHLLQLLETVRQKSLREIMLNQPEFFGLEIWLVIGVTLLWLYDGAPPLRYLIKGKAGSPPK